MAGLSEGAVVLLPSVSECCSVGVLDGVVVSGVDGASLAATRHATPEASPLYSLTMNFTVPVA